MASMLLLATCSANFTSLTAPIMRLESRSGLACTSLANEIRRGTAVTYSPKRCPLTSDSDFKVLNSEPGLERPFPIPYPLAHAHTHTPLCEQIWASGPSMSVEHSREPTHEPQQRAPLRASQRRASPQPRSASIFLCGLSAILNAIFWLNTCGGKRAQQPRDGTFPVNTHTESSLAWRCRA